MPVRGFLALYWSWQRVKGKLFTFLASPEFAHMGRQSTVQPPVRLVGARHISIGARVFIGSNSWIEVIDVQRTREGPAIEIGDGTSFAGFCTVTAVRQVVIEPHVLIARYVYISDHSHAHASPDRPIKQQGITRIAPVRICEGAWIGQNVVICPGVTIGRNAVIGANSVVRHDVPDFCTAAGAPARVLHSNTTVLTS